MDNDEELESFEDNLYREDESELAEREHQEELENYLYSKVHYASTLNIDESSKENFNEEEKFPEISGKTSWEGILGLKQQPKKSSKPLGAVVGEDSEKWEIDVEDLTDGKKPVEKRYYLQEQLLNIFCFNCGKKGHIGKDCEEDKKVPTCHLCGLEGHSRRGCPNELCFNCMGTGHFAKDCTVKKKKPMYYLRCKRCKFNGHTKEDCSEVWRQFHCTTISGVIHLPPREEYYRRNKKRYCYNCAAQDHFGEDCREPRYSMRPVYSQFIVNYDECAVTHPGTKDETKKKEKEIETKKELKRKRKETKEEMKDARQEKKEPKKEMKEAKREMKEAKQEKKEAKQEMKKAKQEKNKKEERGSKQENEKEVEDENEAEQDKTEEKKKKKKKRKAEIITQISTRKEELKEQWKEIEEKREKDKDKEKENKETKEKVSFKMKKVFNDSIRSNPWVNDDDDITPEDDVMPESKRRKKNEFSMKDHLNITDLVEKTTSKKKSQDGTSNKNKRDKKASLKVNIFNSDSEVTKLSDIRRVVRIDTDNIGSSTTMKKFYGGYYVDGDDIEVTKEIPSTSNKGRKKEVKNPEKESPRKLAARMDYEALKNLKSILYSDDENDEDDDIIRNQPCPSPDVHFENDDDNDDDDFDDYGDEDNDVIDIDSNDEEDYSNDLNQNLNNNTSNPKDITQYDPRAVYQDDLVAYQIIAPTSTITHPPTSNYPTRRNIQISSKKKKKENTRVSDGIKRVPLKYQTCDLKGLLTKAQLRKIRRLTQQEKLRYGIKNTLHPVEKKKLHAQYASQINQFVNEETEKMLKAKDIQHDQLVNNRSKNIAIKKVKKDKRLAKKQRKIEEEKWESRQKYKWVEKS